MSDWQLRAIEKSIQELDIEYALVVVNREASENGTERSGILSRLIGLYRRRKFWGLIVIERTILNKIRGENSLTEQLQSHDVSEVEVFSESTIISVEPEKEGAWYEFPEEAVDKVEQEADIAIRFGFGLIRGDILKAPSLGVLSFHPGDVTKHRGQGPERIFLEDMSMGVSTLQRLNDEVDSGEIVVQGETSVEDAYTYDQVLYEIHELQSLLLTKGLKQMSCPEFEPEPPETLGKYYSHAQRETLPYALRVLLKNISGRLKHLL